MPAIPGRTSSRNLRTAMSPGISRSSGASSKPCPKLCGIGPRRWRARCRRCGPGSSTRSTSSRTCFVIKSCAIAAWPRTRRNCTPVRTGQPGDRQENAARAGPRLISQASSVVNPKTTTRTLPRPADFYQMRAVTRPAAVTNYALTAEPSPTPTFFGASLAAAAQAPLAERRNMLFRGSVVTGGSGRAVIAATGDRTEISRVQALVGTAARPETPLQMQLDRLGHWVVIGAGIASLAMLLIGLLRGYRVASLLRSAVSLGVAAVPEGLPTTVTTTLAFGVRALSRKNLLVRRLEAIEALGSIRLVCFDKTGTLTLNRMSVTRLRWNGQEARAAADGFRNRNGDAIPCGADPDLARLIDICVLCNDADRADAEAPQGSSTEIALLEMAGQLGADVGALRDKHPRLAAGERAEGRRYMVTVHAMPEGARLVAVKGDPSAVLPLCASRSETGEHRTMDEAARAGIEADNLAMAEAGLRVLGIAYRLVTAGEETGASAADLTWLGLVGMADPIRPGAVELVRAFRRAGIATVMLTGDQRATALAIAAEIGLANGHAKVIEGDRLDEVPLQAADQHIFARLTPAQKLEVIAGLQRSGARVAMVGDGVYDTPR